LARKAFRNCSSCVLVLLFIRILDTSPSHMVASPHHFIMAPPHHNINPSQQHAANPQA